MRLRQKKLLVLFFDCNSNNNKTKIENMDI